ncbi:MAG: hypothetical protein ACRD8O_04230 [Bryobacteraceae bacterium]
MSTPGDIPANPLPAAVSTSFRGRISRTGMAEKIHTGGESFIGNSLNPMEK